MSLTPFRLLWRLIAEIARLLTCMEVRVIFLCIESICFEFLSACPAEAIPS